MSQTELASTNRAAFLRQLSASIAEINQPVSAVIMNAESALRLLLAQPTNTEAVRRLLACIVEDGMRAGNIVDRIRAFINESAATEGLPGDQRCDPRGQSRLERERSPSLPDAPRRNRGGNNAQHSAK
jgi:phosphoglycerate-specific signal transduction histidine kinase